MRGKRGSQLAHKERMLARLCVDAGASKITEKGGNGSHTFIVAYVAIATELSDMVVCPKVL